MVTSVDDAIGFGACWCFMLGKYVACLIPFVSCLAVS